MWILICIYDWDWIMNCYASTAVQYIRLFWRATHGKWNGIQCLAAHLELAAMHTQYCRQRICQAHIPWSGTKRTLCWECFSNLEILTLTALNHFEEKFIYICISCCLTWMAQMAILHSPRALLLTWFNFNPSTKPLAKTMFILQQRCSVAFTRE